MVEEVLIKGINYLPGGNLNALRKSPNFDKRTDYFTCTKDGIGNGNAMPPPSPLKKKQNQKHHHYLMNLNE